MRVLVLGASGMLGSMVYHYLCNNSNYEVTGSYCNHILPKLHRGKLDKICLSNYQDIVQNVNIIAQMNYDYIINCLGIIKQRASDYSNNDYEKQSFAINSFLPYALSYNCQKAKIIQITTDCVYDGNSGWYSEDALPNYIDIYSKTKITGELNNNNLLNIRCSIIGPELYKHDSLMDWFLFKSGTKVNGFIDHYWNGVTTLQYAEFIYNILEYGTFDELRNYNYIIHYVKNLPLSKYEILLYLREEFNVKKDIEPTVSGNPINRTLTSKYLQNDLLPMKIAIKNLADYIRSNIEYYSDHKMFI